MADREEIGLDYHTLPSGAGETGIRNRGGEVRRGVRAGAGQLSELGFFCYIGQVLLLVD